MNDDLTSCYNKILDIIKSEKNGIHKKQDFNEIEKRISQLTN